MLAALGVVLSYLLLFPWRGLSFLGQFSTYAGRNPSIHVMIALVLLFYTYISIVRPRLAKKGRQSAIDALQTTLPNVIGALLLAGAAVELVPAQFFASVLGKSAGIRAIFTGVSIGVILPACPFVAYPVIGTLYNSGMISFTGTMALLFGQGIGFICVLTADQVFFNLRISTMRVAFSFFNALIAANLLYLSGFQP